IRTALVASQDVVKAEPLADTLLREALQGAAQAAESVLSGSRGSRVRANLMVPFRSVDDVRAFANSVGGGSPTRFQMAEGIWRRMPRDPTAFLGVVGETEKDQHSGFWVPVAQGEGGVHLPGAPHAFETGEGSAVMKADVPPLHGFPAALD